MCGICGVVGGTVSRKKPLFMKALRALKNRGPDHEGYYQDSSCLLGSRRLAIIDLSSKANQPLSNEDKTLWLVFNGEIYNFKELREELEKGGHTFRSNTDSECILHAYEEYGADCLKHLRGMFAFALYDKKKKQVFLARDRIGEKPLVYSFWNKQLSFSSEIVSLLEFGMPKDIDSYALHLYFSYVHIPPPYTIFKHIRKLPPAHYLLWKPGKKPIVKPYWRIRCNRKLRITLSEAAEQCRALLDKTVQEMLVADVPVGIQFSGGVDSSGIVSLLSTHHQERKTFTIGFEHKHIRDPEFQRANIISKKYGTEHHNINYRFSNVKDIPSIVHAYGEPLNNFSTVYSHPLCKFIKENKIIVTLAGNGADELIGGYEGYTETKRVLFFSKMLRYFPQIVTAFFLKMFSLPQEILTIIYSEDPARFRYASVLLPAGRNIQYLYSSSFGRDVKGRDVTLPLKQMRDLIEAKDALDMVLMLDVLSYHAHSVTTVADISGMQHGLEVRNPYLDYRFIEYIASLPMRFKVPSLFSSKKNKLVLKKALEGFIPRDLLYAPKLGFGYNIDWPEILRKDWYTWTKHILLERALQKTGFFNMQYIKKILEEHKSEKENHCTLLWGLVCFELWYEMFIIGKKPEQLAKELVP